MPIEFRCTACNKLLRTADETAGKQAKCPECGAITEIPAPGAAPPAAGPPSAETPAGPAAAPPGASGSPFAPPPVPPPGTADEENPYQSPVDYAAPPSYAPAPGAFAPAPGAFAPTRIDIGDVFSRTWAIFKEQWGLCVGAVVIVVIVSYAAAFATGFITGILGQLAGDEAVAVVLSLMGQFVYQLFAVWLSIGLTLLLLKIARGEEASLGDIFRGGPFFITVLLAAVLFTLMYLGGLLLCVIPGIILGLMFSQFKYLVIDRGAAVMESLRLSKDITTGNKLSIFAVYLLGGLLNIAGVLACCVGVLVTAPYVALLGPVMYLAMTGQPTADQRYRAAAAGYPAGPAPSPFGPAGGGEAGGANIGGGMPNNP